MPKKLFDWINDNTNLIIFLALFIFVYTLVSITAISSLLDRQREGGAELAAGNFIVTTDPSEELMVGEKTVAEKLNLQRKVISPRRPSDIARITRIVEDKGGEVLKTGSNTIVVEIPKENEQNIIDELEKSDLSESLEVDYPTFLSADRLDWGVQRIEADKVWNTTSATGIRIAVIDTGIDYRHPDLRGRYAGGYDVVNGDNDPFDDHGHGTHVSGIIASDLDQQGIAGVAPKASILAVKALSSDGTGYISDLVEAVDWAVNNGAQVINYSLGTNYNSRILENKINEAAGKGVFQVAAAGNTHGGSLLYPAAYGAVVAVAATDRSDNLASFSSLGAEISAPGVSITSTVPGGGYASWSGTSMAAPHVSATVALMISNNQADIRKNLQNTAIDLGPEGRDSYFGYGLVHARPAVLGEDVLALLVTFLSPRDGVSVSGTVRIVLDVQDEASIEATALLLNNRLVKEWRGEQDSYEYRWDTRGLSDGTYEFLAKATDDSGNEGEAKISVRIGEEDTTTTPSPVQIRSPLEQGQSSGVRRDIYQEPAQENRRDYYNVPSSPQEARERSFERFIPEISNINQRNQRPEIPSQGQGGGRRDVRGVENTVFDRLIRVMFNIFKNN